MSATTATKWFLVEAMIVAVWLFIVLTSGIGTTTAIVMFMVMNFVPLTKLYEAAEHRLGRRC
ncbi:MAG TPA: hypothetical protein VFY10_02435 [Dehalococcoidia bacterium]|nr:hypothetical protein [Dehalococcoidia bacterium]